MEQPCVLISLKEYERLKKIANEFEELLKSDYIERRYFERSFIFRKSTESAVMDGVAQILRYQASSDEPFSSPY